MEGTLLQNHQARGKLLTIRAGGFIVCPECERIKAAQPAWRVNRSLLRIEPDTRARALRVQCRSCKKEIILDIDEAGAFESLSQ